jgi:predicted O-methyltransferase YrrM
MNIIRESIRAVEGCSLAAVRTLVSRGPGPARKVMGETLKAATPPDQSLHTMTAWSLVRSFPLGQEVSVKADGWFDGSTAPLERFLMAYLVRYFQPKTILEIGTYRGTTTRLFLDNMPATTKIYTVDLPLGTEAAEIEASTDARLIKHRRLGIDFQGHPLEKNVTQVLGNTMDQKTWENIPAEIDFAFIDASHSYEAVKVDSEQTFKKLSSRGVVLWHDYSENETAERGVGKYIRELMRSREDIFICPETDIAFRIPLEILLEGAQRVPDFFPDKDYWQRHSKGPVPWLRHKLKQ